MADTIINTFGVCAGVGMLDIGLHIGLEYLGLSGRAVGYVERDAYAAAVLLARMEDKALEPAPVWAGNLEAVGWRRWAGCVDGLVAGFPCQPWSHAGKRAGQADERWLWPDIAGIICEIKPGFCFFENVSGLVSGGGLEHVLFDLARLGYDAEWTSVKASDVGANHQRERVFILAYAAGERFRETWGDGQRSTQRAAGGGVVANGHGDGLSAGRAVWPGKSDSAGNSEAVGDSNRERKQQSDNQTSADAWQRSWAGAGGTGGVMANTDGGQFLGTRWRPAQGGNAGSTSAPLADASSKRLQRGERGGSSGTRYRPLASGSASQFRSISVFAPGPNDPAWKFILDQYPQLSPSIVADSVRVYWDRSTGSVVKGTAESGVCGMADGLAVVVDESRADQLRCIGNGVVALQAAAAFVVLARRAGFAIR